MAIGLRGQSGRLVLSHVEEGPKTEFVHVPTHRLSMEVSVAVMQKKHRLVENIHVQVRVSVWSEKALSVKPTPTSDYVQILCKCWHGKNQVTFIVYTSDIYQVQVYTLWNKIYYVVHNQLYYE